MQHHNELLDILLKEVAPAAGCTEPVAVAYSAAVARKHLAGEFVAMEIWMDPYLYKNGMRVGIPGIKERGLEVAAALGFVVGDPEKGLLILKELNNEQVQKVQELIIQNKILLHINEQQTGLFIETLLTTDQGKVRVITRDHHLNIVHIDKGGESVFQNSAVSDFPLKTRDIQKYDIEEILLFINQVPIEKLAFLREGLAMNMAMAKEGLDLPRGIGKSYSNLIDKELMQEDVIRKAQILCAGASEARMSGSALPVMSVTGSGNHGITVFLTVAAVAQNFRSSEEKCLRALALSILLTAYIKSYTGTLSAMCGCGVAAGVGASAGAVYLLDGNSQEIVGAMRNMIGSISGLICDGAKEGCAYKLAMASGWAVEAALLALQGSIINEADGIVNIDYKKMIMNLGHICSPGMITTNNTIVSILNAQC